MKTFDSLLLYHRAAIASSIDAVNGPAKAPATDELYKGIALQPGTRVLDTSTGQLGTVLAGSVKHTLKAPGSQPGAAQPGAFFNLPTPGQVIVITVLLNDGSIVDRDETQLHELPPALTLPLANLGPVEK